MDSLIETFHIDWKLVIAQVVNFAIVLGVLWFFALKPLLKIMRERSSKIEKSLEQAKEIEEKLQDAEKEHQSVVKQARKESLEILEKAALEALEERRETTEKAKGEVAAIINAGKEQLAQEKNKMISEVRAQAADLIIEATARILGSDKALATGKELSKKVLEELKNEKN